MKKFLKIVLIIIGILICIFLLDILQAKILKNGSLLNIILNNMTYSMKAVVVKVNDNSLLAVNEKTDELYSIGFTEEGNIGFKKGQEILFYFNGTVTAMYPGIPDGVTKIKIINEESEKEIPERILRYCYNSKENVKVTVNELTTSSMTLTITDTNELPYEYLDDYTIYEKVKNEKYTGTGEIIGENTEHSTSGFTRNRIRI